jgi:hypothetical protein
MIDAKVTCDKCGTVEELDQIRMLSGNDRWSLPTGWATHFLSRPGTFTFKPIEHRCPACEAAS